MGNVDIQLIMQIGIALGIVTVFRILSSFVSKTIIKILSINTDVKKNPFYRPLKTIITFRKSRYNSRFSNSKI